MKNIEKDFKSSIHQSFESVQQSLIELLHKIQTATQNNYQNLLNSNIWGKYYHRLTVEELFLMNLNNKEILAILNISIYNTIHKKDFRILMDGIYTYSRLRALNWAYTFFTDEWTVVESLITNDRELRDLLYPKSLSFNDEKLYPSTILLGGNFLKTILLNPVFKDETHQQYSELIEEVSGKFDTAFLHYLYSLTSNDTELAQTSFAQMEQLYSQCKWLATGWYKEANLNKIIPVFLLGLYQLKKITADKIEIDFKNIYLANAEKFILDNPDYKPKVAFEFTGELQFLNQILTDEFSSAYTNLRAKITEIKILNR